MMPQGMGMPAMTGMPMMQPQAALGTGTMTTGALGMGPRIANGGSTGMPAGVGTSPAGKINLCPTECFFIAIEDFLLMPTSYHVIYKNNLSN